MLALYAFRLLREVRRATTVLCRGRSQPGHKSLRSKCQVERALGLPCLGVVPQVKGLKRGFGMLALKLAERCDFALVPRFLVGYRATPRNMSSDPRRISRSEAMVLEEARRRHPELPARLFRLAIARAEFRAAQRHLRCGMLIPGLIFLLKVVGRDPVAVAYKLAEKSRGWLSRDQ